MLIHKCKDKIEINFPNQFENKPSKSKNEVLHKTKSQKQKNDFYKT